MVQRAFISGPRSDSSPDGAVRLSGPERDLVLNRLRQSSMALWAVAFLVATLLFLFTAPAGFRLTLPGISSLAGLLLLGTSVSLLHLRGLGRTLATKPLGPD